MTSDELHRHHTARPFHPFTLELADGQRVHIPHPEFLAHPRGSRIAVAITPQGVSKSIDVLMIVAIHAGNGRARRGRKKAG